LAAQAVAQTVMLLLLAPVLPFVTEEVWSWWQVGSIHTAAWPVVAELGPAAAAAAATAAATGSGGEDPVLEVTASVLGRIRQAKSTAKRSMRSPVETLTVVDTPARIAALLSAEGDLRDAGAVVTLVTGESTGTDEATVAVELAPEG
ncbi:MAG: class I tRNA ligase family protein, partial [Acidimicrobiales bacterium]